MKQFLVFTRKEFYHIFRDRRSLLIIIAMPIMQIILFGFALTNETKNSKIVILDHSHDNATQDFIQRLDASRYFDIVETAQTEKDIHDALRSGKAKLAVIFPAEFSQGLAQQHAGEIQMIADASDPNTATTILFYATNIINEYQKELLGEQELPYTIHPEVRMLYNPQLKGAYVFVPGVMGMILLLISAMMTSIAIVREKELNTMEVILASPLKPVILIFSKAIPYIALSLVNVTTILVISVTLLDLPIAGNIFLLYAECFLFISTAICFGLMISSFTNSQQTAMLISLMGLMLPTLIFSGFMFPIENMPVPMQVISNIIPTKWFFIIMKDVMIKGLSFSFIWKQTLILSGMTMFFLAMSIRRFKIRLQ